MKLYDEQGNEYTPEQVASAIKQKNADESGQGSFGGLNDTQDGEHTPTADPYAAAADKWQAQQGEAAGPQVTAPTNEAPEKPASERELNPMHLGRFLHDNLFGGIGHGYVTGKRPTTAFDLASDVVLAYNGEDLTRRNASFINEDLAKQRGAREGVKAAVDLKKTGIDTQKAQLDVGKELGTHIADMMQNYDSDLWATHIKTLAKEQGVNVPAATVQMVQRMAEGLNTENAAHPGDVLENPDQYSPELFNRVRHTMTLLNKNVQESTARDLESSQKQQALGMRPGGEQRAQAKRGQEQAGIGEAVQLLTKQADSDDPTARRQALAGIAALHQGGAAAQKVLEQLSGTGTAARTPNPTATSILRDAAIARLQKKTPGVEPGPAELQAEMSRLQSEQAGEVALSKGQAAQRQEMAANLASLQRYFTDPQYDKAVKETLWDAPNLGSSVITGEAARPVKAANARAFQDRLNAGNDSARYLASVVQTIIPRIRADAMGTKGLRINMAELALLDQGASDIASGNTTASAAHSFKRRALHFIQQTQDALNEGELTTVKDQARPGISASGVSKTSEGDSAQRQKAEQWAALIKAAPPEQRAAMTQKAVKELGQ